MGAQEVLELVEAPVGLGIGIEGRAQEAQAEDAAARRVAVLAVVEEGEAVVLVREVDPAMGAEFEFGEVPLGVGHRRPRDLAEGDLAEGLPRADRRGEEDP